MLGLLLYETVDVIYNIGRIGVNSVYGLYNWYYYSNEKLNEEQNKFIELERKIKELEDKLNEQEYFQNNQNIKLKHNTSYDRINYTENENNEINVFT